MSINFRGQGIPERPHPSEPEAPPPQPFIVPGPQGERLVNPEETANERA